ncbi:rRNA maturation RNase YbeY [Cyclobacterium jeungdonense]|uniref:Endoribonuclease YbeY n=1 Tax=Cyclobacterium jeungdonense TaxID=708087 RepID=A0ABT8C7N3_9BACT|nr:rRNA maturation RNase YbeY [Cyclobacterium jeungdonense]MDN3687613.1 rRNA maturation RNase YbeY [Cyclobacterium jeungdonense]
MAIYFFEEETQARLKQRRLVKRWIQDISLQKGFRIQSLNFIFCTDPYLLDINISYLKHDTYTDIITFDQSEIKGNIEADIFISTDRVKENAYQQNSNYHTELLRVMIHGVLHLCGYKDSSPEEKNQMRREETRALQLFESLSVPRGTPKR